ncbi:hypothetical protein HYH02_001432 [Chlamydomonas schloesseri]|uniref:Uncharacterized protein n=1 Tax=Chlamydomonas schloesseri TaxID=2026947 RepID=A0A835WY20_9CHLO|nr:hypothetical protein HYH02_001432 [Chlamydomonas schloesseri]|eukprot:KAG2454410.1 hypothetical protein HYH02_001432 [Chlamydomonas schloesseri]
MASSTGSSPAQTSLKRFEDSVIDYLISFLQRIPGFRKGPLPPASPMLKPAGGASPSCRWLTPLAAENIQVVTQVMIVAALAGEVLTRPVGPTPRQLAGTCGLAVGAVLATRVAVGYVIERLQYAGF